MRVHVFISFSFRFLFHNIFLNILLFILQLKLDRQCFRMLDSNLQLVLSWKNLIIINIILAWWNSFALQLLSSIQYWYFFSKFSEELYSNQIILMIYTFYFQALHCLTPKVLNNYYLTILSDTITSYSLSLECIDFYNPYNYSFSWFVIQDDLLLL